MLNKIIAALAILVSLVLLANGVGWLVSPEVIAAQLGMTLLEGVGLSTQIGDLAAFFLTAGIFGLLGVLRKSPVLLYTPAALVGLAALCRTIAMQHGAPFAPQIFPEIVMLVVYIVAAIRLGNSAAPAN